MKTLHYRRHSIKDGPNNTIGPKGIVLARAEGEKVDITDTSYARGFHGPLVRTAQTLLAFSRGLGYVPDPMPVVPEIGTDDLFAAMATPEFRQTVAGGASNFTSLVTAHGFDQCRDWAIIAALGVASMFGAMGQDEMAIAFGHSPVIELAIWRLCGHDMPEVFLRQIADMEGAIFTEENDKIEVLGKIIVI